VTGPANGALADGLLGGGEILRNAERFLTTPEEWEDYRPFAVTGNEYVALPLISPHDAGIERLNVIRMDVAGLVGFSGTRGWSFSKRQAVPQPSSGIPFMLPSLRVQGQRVEMGGKLKWQRLAHWVPRFVYEDGTLVWEGTIYAPPGEKGFVIDLRVDNAGALPLEICLGLEGCWLVCLQTIYTSRPLFIHHCVSFDRWARGPVLEARSERSLMAVAISPSERLDICHWAVQRISGHAAEEGPPKGGATEGADGGAGGPAPMEIPARPDWYIALQLGKHYRLAPGQTARLTFYCGVNKDSDGARTTAVHLNRRGREELLQSALTFLADKARTVPDPQLTGLLNLNLFFNYFYALGQTIDTEELVCLTSRSPLYYVSAAFWARDTLLWSFPALLLVDAKRAEAVLRLAFTRYLHNAGVHSLYIDGTVLYPGFELDELCAYLIALGHYLDCTGDLGILDEQVVRRAVEYLDSLFWPQRAPKSDVMLFRTFLLPSDDPAQYPYVTYDNVLAWRAFLVLAKVYDYWGLQERARRSRNTARQIKESIYEHLVARGPYGPMFAWAADLEGNFVLYDEPPGSLQLLTYYGFCSVDDPVYQNTVEWIHSKHNPYHYGEVPFPGVGCPHAEHPFVMSLFNALLSGREDLAHHALQVLRRAPFDGGVACESYDRWTGRVKTGAAFATCAGFLAYAIYQRLNQERKRNL